MLTRHTEPAALPASPSGLGASSRHPCPVLTRARRTATSPPYTIGAPSVPSKITRPGAPALASLHSSGLKAAAKRALNRRLSDVGNSVTNAERRKTFKGRHYRKRGRSKTKPGQHASLAIARCPAASVPLLPSCALGISLEDRAGAGDSGEE